MFERQPDGTWLEVAKLVGPPDGVFALRFGWSVAISGGRALVGAYDAHLSGAVYVYERQPDGSWPWTATLLPHDAANTMAFGTDVDIQGDTAIVGEPLGHPFNLQGIPQDLGSVYVFERQPNGTWDEVQVLRPGHERDLFGSCVALDGDRLVAGAPEDGLVPDPGPADWHYTREGAAYVFERSGGSAWSLAAKLESTVDDEDTYFGWSVALSGARVVAGVRNNGAPGFAELFEHGDGAWPSAATLALGEHYGVSVAIHGDRVLASTSGKSSVVHAFQRDPAGTWKKTIELQASYLGFNGLALDGERALVANSANVSLTPGWLGIYEGHTLYHGAPTISAQNGGSQELFLRAGAQHAGELYVMLGSASGTSPGIVVDADEGLVLPLVPDGYTQLLLKAAGAGLVNPFVGVLDAEGAALATFSLPSGSDPSLAGLVLHHAFVALGLAGSGGIGLASNAARLSLVP